MISGTFEYFALDIRAIDADGNLGLPAATARWSAESNPDRNDPR